jgi:anti-sigma B factor antagonist
VEITKRLEGEVLVLAPTGKLAIGAGETRLRDAIRSALADGHRKLLVDMRGVSMLDSSGVGELVGGYTSALKRGGTLKLAHVGVRALRTLSATQLTAIFEIFDDDALALRSFSSPPA